MYNNGNSYSIKRLLFVIVMMVLVIGGGTFAWFTYQSKESALVLTIGNINDTQITLTPYQINEVMAPGTTYESGVYSEVNVTSGNKNTSMRLFYKINQLDINLIDKGLAYTVIDSSDNTVVSGYFYELIDISEELPEQVVIFDSASKNETYKVYLWLDSNKGADQSDLVNTTLNMELNGSIGSVSISGNSMYNETLSALVSETDNDKNYTYQWYYNTNNSTTGGTAIEGANESTYKEPSSFNASI